MSGCSSLVFLAKQELSGCFGQLSFVCARRITTWLADRKAVQRSVFCPSLTRSTSVWQASVWAPIKINVDGALSKKASFKAFGYVIWDSAAMLIQAASMGFAYAAAEPMVVEAWSDVVGHWRVDGLT